MRKENTQAVRLSAYEKNCLMDTLEAELTKRGGGQVWLFGSRVNLEAKGGDIDLYIELNTPIEKKLAFVRQLTIALEKKLGLKTAKYYINKY